MNEKKITKISFEFRRAILTSYISTYFEWFKSFPRGCCKESSLLLGKFLHDFNIGLFYIISGERSGSSHIWLKKDNLIVDITGDQFEDMPIDVYVGYDSYFHSTFTTLRDAEAYDAVFNDMNTNDYNLKGAYDKILLNMNLELL